MTTHSPTFIYLGNNPQLINADWNSGNTATNFTSAAEAEVVEGWEFDARDMEATQVSGEPSGTGVFVRGVDQLSYSLDDGVGGKITQQTVYTSHIVVEVKVGVVRYDPEHGGANAQGLVQGTASLRGVLVQMANGDLFLRPYYEDAAAWEMTLTDWAIDTIAIDKVAQQSDNTDRVTGGFSATTSYPPKFIGPLPQVPCFTLGTLIDTPNGAVPIETLSVGDPVTLFGGGVAKVLWLGGKTLSADELAVAGHLRPVRIEAHALGANRPRLPLELSPQHRLALESPVAARMSGSAVVLIAAKELLDHPGVSLVVEERAVRYLHILLERHAVIIANGLPAESLLLGPEAVESLSKSDLAMIQRVAPDLLGAMQSAGQSLPVMRGRRLRSLLTRHRKNGIALRSAASQVLQPVGVSVDF